MPVDLYESVKGDYFIGCADGLALSDDTSCWARLYNPSDSCVNLHVNVWTITEISTAPFRAEFWFNADAPSSYTPSQNVICSNTAFCSVPTPQIELQMASNVTDEPNCGTMAYVRCGEPITTLVGSDDGKLIFKPGGSLLIFLSLINCDSTTASASIAFGWWEEEI
ncbi:hypothetical protein SDC9_157897 [bioreactor metagenome]|uniref:Uncharacterized protein n=1 Tax=bioreactor metagenome TaxID=1076179 RepID=A0A645FAL5_9ZZZZ